MVRDPISHEVRLRQFLAVGRAIVARAAERGEDPELTYLRAGVLIEDMAKLFVAKSQEYGDSWYVASRKLESVKDLLNAGDAELALSFFDTEDVLSADGIGPSSLFVEMNAKHIRHRNLLWENPKWRDNAPRIVETLIDSAVYAILEVMLIVDEMPEVVKEVRRLQEVWKEMEL